MQLMAKKFEQEIGQYLGMEFAANKLADYVNANKIMKEQIQTIVSDTNHSSLILF